MEQSVYLFPNGKEADQFGEELYGMCPQPFSGIVNHSIRFTGWKHGGFSVRDATPWNPISGSGFVAQWIWWMEIDKPRNYYVNLPGFQAGAFARGGCFEIGEERVHKGVTKDEITILVLEGKRRLIELVKEKEGIDIQLFFAARPEN